MSEETSGITFTKSCANCKEAINLENNQGINLKQKGTIIFDGCHMCLDEEIKDNPIARVFFSVYLSEHGTKSGFKA